MAAYLTFKALGKKKKNPTFSSAVLFAFSGLNSQCAGLYQDVQPLPKGAAAD